MVAWIISSPSLLSPLFQIIIVFLVLIGINIMANLYIYVFLEFGFSMYIQNVAFAALLMTCTAICFHFSTFYTCFFYSFCNFVLFFNQYLDMPVTTAPEKKSRFFNEFLFSVALRFFIYHSYACEESYIHVLSITTNRFYESLIKTQRIN